MYTDENNHFYELEPAVVLDVILDETHPIFKTKTVNLDYTSVPDRFDGKPVNPNSIDYSWIGRILVRPLVSAYKVDKDDINDWAIPMESTGIVEYPLVNEVVIIGKYFKKLYYFKKLNIPNGFLNNNADFSKERIAGPSNFNLEKRVNPNETSKLYQGPESTMISTKYATKDDKGALGRYFLANRSIRSIKKYEGDTVIESRFGQSIRFSAYDSNRDNDVGSKEYRDYYNQIKNPYTNKPSGGGNPMILIRNRQRPIQNVSTESNPGGFISEDINNDGSSIHITSGLTQSPFIIPVIKHLFQDGFRSSNEISQFYPNGSTNFKFPKLIGDQIVINTDRLILSSKAEETFHFSKKRYAVATDDEYTVDAEKQIVITSNTKTVLNSPAIFLGEYDQTNEPAVLGQTLVDWLYDLCNWLLDHKHGHNHIHPHPHVHTHPHIHPYPHVHKGGAGGGVVGPPIPPVTLDGKTTRAPDDGTVAAIISIGTGDAAPGTDVDIGGATLNAIPVNTLNAVPVDTEIPKEIQELRQIRDSLGMILSKRVFLTGGGYAPGTYSPIAANTVINPYTGEGVPGGYKSTPFSNIRRGNPPDIYKKFLP